MDAKCDQTQSDVDPESGGLVTIGNFPEDFQARYFLFSLVEIHTPISYDDAASRMTNQITDSLKKFFYAIRDISVNGRCFCNGHANQCDLTDPLNRVCVCQHKTDGANCEVCSKFHSNRPWQRLNRNDKGFECERCSCNGKSSDCEFDQNLWETNFGSDGGMCLSCQNNFTGPNCDKCDLGYFESSLGSCEPCACNLMGSIDLECGSNGGKCRCKPGVTGDYCGECAVGFYGFGNTSGCSQCHCDEQGTQPSDSNLCSPSTGECPCKSNVEGPDCSACKPGFFGLREDNPAGCSACFCSNHSAICEESLSKVSVTAVQFDLSKAGEVVP